MTRRKQTAAHHSAISWWLSPGTEACLLCEARVYPEALVYCVACDRPCCPFCVMEVAAGEPVCPECAQEAQQGGGE